eukprot:TRINITY_DN389_c0_g1_i1.p2 TRINITY_DN389_c0_g1~~TRINITY_DN389_c0_g1_i1.p2  ORF type:complete len:122 (+),score=28.48 TRINITY_DN389_c0_g1_i1:36-401(+)
MSSGGSQVEQDSNFHKDENLLAEGDLPLQRTWVAWYDYVPSGRDLSAEQYEAAMKEICICDNIQTFWQFFNNLPVIYRLPNQASVHMMIQGIKPIWEDPANEDGGFWKIKVENKVKASYCI